MPRRTERALATRTTPWRLSVSVICWVAFAWIPWAIVAWLNRPFADDDVSLLAQTAIGAPLVGAALSAFVLRGKELGVRVLGNWPWLVLHLVGLLAAAYLVWRALVVALNWSHGGVNVVLGCAAVLTIAYTSGLVAAALRPEVFYPAAARLLASASRHRTSLGPVTGAVAGSLILILSADVWQAMEEIPLTAVVAVWTLGTSISVALARNGQRGLKAISPVAVRLLAAGVLAFVAFFVVGANLAPPEVVLYWIAGSPYSCLARGACEAADYADWLAKLAILLASLIVTTAATTIGGQASAVRDRPFTPNTSVKPSSGPSADLPPQNPTK